MAIELKVGYWYKRRDGGLAQVLKKLTYPVSGNVSNLFAVDYVGMLPSYAIASGEYLVFSPVKHRLDLIEEIGPTLPLTLEVGKTYRRRDGKECRVIYVRRETPTSPDQRVLIVALDDDEDLYTCHITGHYRQDKSESSFDIVEEVV